MHSSRMRTGRTLTVFRGGCLVRGVYLPGRGGGGVSGSGGCTWSRGVWSWGGVSGRGGVCAQGGVPGLGGCTCLVRGGGCTCLVQRGVWSRGCTWSGGCTCLVRGGGCTCPGGVPGSGGGGWVYLPGLGGVWSRGVYLVRGVYLPGGVPGPEGGVPAWSGGVPGQVLPPVDRHTLVKILPWPKLRFGR